MATNGTRDVPGASAPPEQEDRQTAYTPEQLCEMLLAVNDRFADYAAGYDPAETALDREMVSTTIATIISGITNDQAYQEVCDNAHQQYERAEDLENRCRQLEFIIGGLRGDLARAQEQPMPLIVPRHAGEQTPGETDQLRNELEAARKEAEDLRNENKALRAWKDGKLKSETARRTSLQGQQAQIDGLRTEADRLRRELEAAKRDAESARKVAASSVQELAAARDEREAALRDLRKARVDHGQETQRLTRSLGSAQEEAAALRTKAEDLKKAEAALARQTQVFMAKRAQTAVEQGIRPSIIILTTSAIHEATVKAEQDPRKTLLSFDFDQLLELAKAGLRRAPSEELVAIVQRNNGGVAATPAEATSQLRSYLDLALLTIHKLVLHLEESVRQVDVLLRRGNTAEANLKQTRATLRAAWDALRTADDEAAILSEALMALNGKKS